MAAVRDVTKTPTQPPPPGLPRARGRSMVEDVAGESRLGRRQAAGSSARTASATASLGAGKLEGKYTGCGILCGKIAVLFPESLTSRAYYSCWRAPTVFLYFNLPRVVEYKL